MARRALKAADEAKGWQIFKWFLSKQTRKLDWFVARRMMKRVKTIAKDCCFWRLSVALDMHEIPVGARMEQVDGGDGSIDEMLVSQEVTHSDNDELCFRPLTISCPGIILKGFLNGWIRSLNFGQEFLRIYLDSDFSENRRIFLDFTEFFGFIWIFFCVFTNLSELHPNVSELVRICLNYPNYF